MVFGFRRLSPSLAICARARVFYPPLGDPSQPVLSPVIDNLLRADFESIIGDRGARGSYLSPTACGRIYVFFSHLTEYWEVDAPSSDDLTGALETKIAAPPKRRAYPHDQGDSSYSYSSSQLRGSILAALVSICMLWDGYSTVLFSFITGSGSGSGSLIVSSRPSRRGPTAQHKKVEPRESKVEARKNKAQIRPPL